MKTVAVSAVTAVVVAVLVVFLFGGFAQPQATVDGPQGIVGASVSNFTSVDISNDLAVGDDATIAGDLTVANQIVEMTTTERLQILAPTAQPTATPGLRINVAGVNEPLVILRSLTPVARVNGAGQLTIESLVANGASTLTGAVNSATALLTGRQVVTVPTAQATATPGVYVNSAGAVSALQVWALSGTPVASIDKTGKATLGSAVIGTSITHGDQGAVTVTNGGTITVTDDVVPLTASGGVGATVSGCATANKLTYLYNTANQTITITDTGNIVLGGNAALGQYDSLTLLGDGTRCIQVSKADN